jgi:hypothetical protein
MLVEMSLKAKMPELLEAEWVQKSNNAFHDISEKVEREIGLPKGKRVYKDWEEWIKKELKKNR